MKELLLCLTVFTMAIAGSIDPELEEVLSSVPPDSMMAPSTSKCNKAGGGF